ncbi:MAG TPA: LuxR C-terminal-related transcriptional regulator [Candidatus Saccharimonadales bacterium]|nr:LuxR C-terminal-related transcriptional regulator [Candidatus Saccharimonadales bacterium]
MHQTTVDPESYLEGAHLRLTEPDPANLSPIDFYWWNMEQGSLEKAVCSLESYEDCLKFAEGMREEVVERSGGDYYYNPAITVRKQIVKALAGALEAETDTDYGTQTELIKRWGIVMSDLIAAGEEATTPTGERIASNLNLAAKEIADAGSLLQTLLKHSDEATRRRFDLTQEDVDMLESISRGDSLKQQSAALELPMRTIKRQRTRVKDKLGADSLSHAVCIAIENGIIALDNPVPEEPELELNPKHLEALKLAAAGHSAEEIGRIQDVSIEVVNSRLGGTKQKNQGGAKARLDAKNRPHLIRKAFEAGILTPQNPGPSFMVRDTLGRLPGLGAQFNLIRSQSSASLPESTMTGIFMELAGHVPEHSPDLMGTIEHVEPDELLSGVKDNFAVAKQALHRITKDISRILTDIGDFTQRLDFSPFSPNEQEELEQASLGAEAKNRPHVGIIQKSRTNIVRRTGATGLVEAVSISIGDEHLPVDWSEDIYSKPVINDPILVRIIALISQGFGTPEIAEIMSSSKNPTEVKVRTAKETVGATNRVHLVRRAIEERVIPPGGSNEELHRALATAAGTELKVAKISEALSGINQ